MQTHVYQLSINKLLIEFKTKVFFLYKYTSLKRNTQILYGEK